MDLFSDAQVQNVPLCLVLKYTGMQNKQVSPEFDAQELVCHILKYTGMLNEQVPLSDTEAL